MFMEQGVTKLLFDNILSKINDYKQIGEVTTMTHGIKGMKIIQQPNVKE